MTGRVAVRGGLTVLAAAWCSLAVAVPDGTHKRELWPVFESIRSDEMRSVTVRPLFDVSSNRREPTRRVDVLYPFFKWQTLEDGSLRWWLMPIAYYMRDVDTNGRSETDMALLPVLFVGSSSDGTEDYLAVFPVGGTMKQFFNLDKIAFVAFPAYLYLERGDYTSRSVLWPVFAAGKGTQESAWRVWPLYGERRVDDTLVYRTVLWPIYSQWHKDDSTSVLVFPLYHTMRSETHELWSVVPPLFSYDVKPADQFRRWRMPWPIVEVVRSETERTTRVWPLWGRRDRPRRTSSFILWPAFTSDETEDDDGSREIRRRFLLCGLSETVEDEETGPVERYLQFWPLFHWTASAEPAQTEFNILSPLWFRHGADRFWSMYGPFWTLYRHESRDDGTVADHVLGRIVTYERAPHRKRVSVWPLFAYTREDGSREIELFKGLWKSRRGPAGRELRMLWFFKMSLSE